MTIFTSCGIEKEESEKIAWEPCLYEKNFDIIGEKTPMMKPRKKFIDLEAIFENLAGPEESYSWKYSFLRFISLIAIISLFVISMKAPIEESMENGKPTTYLGWQIWLLVPIAFLCLGFYSRPTKYTYKRHFTEINKKYLKWIIFFVAVFAGSIFWKISLKWFTIIMTTLVCTIVLNVFIDFINSQKATKLRFDPCKDNCSYTLIRAESKDKETIRIVESSVFKITIQNIGSEPWNSEDCTLHRHTGIGRSGECFTANLPQFTLSPQEQVDLIPETADYDGECVRIPNVHCFGLRDRHTQVKTFISFGNKGADAKEDEDDIRRCAYKTKIAEHIVTYTEKEWTNINPC